MENVYSEKDLKKGRKTLSGAAVIAAGGLVSKIFGAVYRIILIALLGAEGLGAYQTVFPAYCLFLDISSSGVPAATSKLVSERPERGKEILNKSLYVFASLGAAFSVIMAVFSKGMAWFQGNRYGYIMYVVISPAIALVAILSCFKGYFQGNGNMYPTGITQITEQIIKIAFGYYMIRAVYDLKAKVTMAVFAVTVSEIAAVSAIFIIYGIHSLKEKKNDLSVSFLYDNDGQRIAADKINGKKIFAAALPITLASLAFPLADVLESAIFLRGFGDTGNALSVYGVYAGAVKTFINLPVSVCYGLAAAAIPVIAGKMRLSKKRSSEASLITLTFLFSTAGALLCFIFSPVAVRIIFPSLKEYFPLTITLIRVSSVTVILAALVQTTNAILIAKGKTYITVISCFTGMIIKTLLSAYLVFYRGGNIFVIAISSILCYLVAVLINLKYTFKYANKRNNA